MKLAIMVPFHLNDNQKYLDLALDSLVEQKTENLEVSIYCIASSEHAPRVPNAVKLIHDKSLSNATKKFNHFFSQIENASDLLMVMSDDVILSQNSLEIMADSCLKFSGIINPMGNNDNGIKYLRDIHIVIDGEKIPLTYRHEYEELRPYIDQIKNYKTFETILVPSQDFVSFYCTMMTRDVFNKVGLLKEVYDVRHNDEDYCIRARKQGITCAFNVGAFAFHFGSKTLPRSTNQVEFIKATQTFAKEHFDLDVKEDQIAKAI